MPEDAGDRALAAATQLEKIGFVEFTTHLVRDTYRVIVESSIDQLKAFADFYERIADKTVGQYQDEIVGADSDTKTANADSYIRDVLGLPIDSSPDDSDEISLTADQTQALVQHFVGIQASSKDIATTIGTDSKITLGELRAFVIEKLKKAANASYDQVKTILKLGMQKVVVTNGEIRTKLTFHVDATDTYTKTASDYSRTATNWGIKGSVSGRYGGPAGAIAGVVFGSFIGGGVSGGYGRSKLTVSVVNESSSAATNVTVDILGEVKIQFRTETFPSIE
jgi:hypothetical protein